MTILGIDPGLNHTGFGIISASHNQFSYISSGVIKNHGKTDFFDKIQTIVSGIKTIIEKFKPQIASIEKVFVNVNPNSTLLLGQARGAAIATCTIYDLKIFEYTALQIKKTVTGYGHASKKQIQKIVAILLNMNNIVATDAADALATALTHAFFKQI